MKPPEELLRGPELAGPSGDHRRRMEDLFLSRARRSLLARPVPLWQCAAACLLCAVLSVLAWNALRTHAPVKNEYTENVYYVLNVSDTALPTPAATRSGFLTDPKKIQTSVYSVRHENVTKPLEKI